MSYFAQNKLRLVEFNVENLFLLMATEPSDLSTMQEAAWQKLTVSVTPNKSIAQVRGLARTIQDIDADIYMFCEVGGRESLQNFNRHFLGDQFHVHLIEGNSDRGIDLGYLVHKRLPFKVDLISHKNRSLGFFYPHEKKSIEAGFVVNKNHKFSRDVLELRLFEGEKTEPSLILLQCHLKSPLDRDKIDPNGKDRRKAELEKLVDIYNELKSDFKMQVPILICGDFNGIAAKEHTESEFQAIYQRTDLQCCFEWLQVDPEERFTFLQVAPYGGKSKGRQIDYILVPESLKNKIRREETYVYRYKDEFGMNLPLPRNLAQKRLLPSDHYPVVLTLFGEQTEDPEPTSV